MVSRTLDCTSKFGGARRWIKLIIAFDGVEKAWYDSPAYRELGREGPAARHFIS